MLVEQLALGGFDLEDAIGFDRTPLGRHDGEGAGHVDQANLVGAQHHGGIGVDLGGDAETPRHRGNRAEADFVAELRGHRVDRIGEGGAQIDFTDVASARIARPPAVDIDRRIDHPVVGRVARLKRGEIDEQLPRGTRLAHCIGRAVVIGLDVVGTADQREHGSVAIHAHHRALRPIGRVRLDRSRCRALHAHVERGPDLDRFEGLGQQQVELRQRPVGEITHRVLARLFLEPNCARVDRDIGRNAALFLHQPQHHAGAADRGIDIGGGRIAAGRLDEARDDRRLGHRQFGRRMAEELPAGAVDAIGAATEIDLVEIELEDLLLREFPLERHRQDRLARLAIDRAVVVEEDVARELLADGRGPADARA